MAILYVDSNASGADDGTSWTDAWADIQSAWTAWVSGDVCWVASDHSQTQATEEQFAADVMDDDNPFVMYSVASADDSYTPAAAAQIAVTGSAIDIEFNDSVHAYGIFFQMADGQFDLNQSNTSLYFEDCNFKWTGTTANRDWSASNGARAVNCTFNNTSGSGSYRVVSTNGPMLFEGCVFSGRGVAGSFVSSLNSSNGHAGGTRIVGCDLSGLTNVTDLNPSNSNVRFIGCKFPSGVNVQRPAAGHQYFVAKYACAVDGAGTAKNYIAENYFHAGSVTQDTAIYRDDGWQDEEGSTRLSHKMATLAGLRGPHTPIYGPDLRAYVGSTGSTTFTVYAVEDFTVALTEDEAWIDISYLGTSNSVLWTVGTGRSILSTTSLTTDTKAWTGLSGHRKVKFAETVTINKTGTYVIRVYLGKIESGEALWYDPLVEVS